MIEKFISELQRRGLSKNTIVGYSFDINQFNVWLKSNKLDNSITKEILYEYIEFLTSKYSENTVYRKIKSIIRFNDFLYNFGESTVKVEIKQIYKRRKNIEVKRNLEINDLVRIRKVILESNNKRDILIFHILLGTGCRVSELINIEIDDIEIINPSQGFIKLKNFKTPRFPTYSKIRINEALISMINDYLEVRPVNRSNKLLISQKGPFTRDAINKLFRKYSLMADIKYTFSPNMIRQFVILYTIKAIEINKLNILPNIIQPIVEPSTLTYFKEKYFELYRNIDFESIVKDFNNQDDEGE